MHPHSSIFYSSKHRTLEHINNNDKYTVGRGTGVDDGSSMGDQLIERKIFYFRIGVIHMK